MHALIAGIAAAGEIALAGTMFLSLMVLIGAVCLTLGAKVPSYDQIVKVWRNTGIITIVIWIIYWVLKGFT